MKTIAGIFRSTEDAERAVQQLHSLGIPSDRIGLLMPGTSGREAEKKIRTTETEQPGMGTALGGTVGGAIGAAGGASMGAAVASLLVPGVGPVIAGGLIGAALLGTGGAATGAAAGKALEEGLADGLPHDELYLYEDALRKGRSVVIAFAEDDESAESVRQALNQSGAETVDAAREAWWVGLRDAEAVHYKAKGRDFEGDEESYRRGFEAALHAKRRGKPYDEAAWELSKVNGEISSTDAFRHGYERGQAYQRNVTEIHKV